MDGNNQNNAGSYIPQEIPIPGVTDADGASVQPSESSLSEQHKQDNSYGQQAQYQSYEQQTQYQPYEQQSQNNPYEQSQSNPYGQQTQYQPYGQQSQSNPYEQSQSNPYGQQQNNPYGQQSQYNTYGQQQQDSPHNGSYQYDSYQAQGNMNGQPIRPYQPKKKGAAKIVVAIACVCMALIVVLVGVMVYFRSTPVYKISKGFQNIGKEIAQTRNPLSEKIGGDDIFRMMQEDGCHVDTTLDFSMDMPMVGTMTLGVDTDYYKDMNAKELNAETSISMINYEFAHLNIYANDEVFCFSIPELFMEDMYIENENVVSQFNDSILAEYAESSDAEEFSIDLFSDKRNVSSMRDWKNFSTAFEQTARDLEACKDAMTIEKVEKGLYRVIFPEEEVNRLFKNYLKEYNEIYELTDETSIFDEYDNWITSDVSLLFEMTSNNRIDSIMLEEPVKMLDSEAAVSGELFFLGEDRSIDKIQGKISVEGVDGETREIICQVVQSTTEDNYQVNMDVKYSDDYGDGMIRLVTNCDAVSDEFNMTFSMKDDVDDLEIVLEGGWDDIVKGESAKFELQKLAFTMDDEELFRISGDIMVEPIKDKIKPSVEAKTAFFEMTFSDWEDIIYQLDDEYGSLLDALW